MIDDINDYTYDQLYIYFKNGYKLEIKNLIDFNINNANNKECNIIKLIYKNKFIKVWFSDGNVKIFYLNNIDFNNYKIAINKIILNNGLILTSKYIYDNSYLLHKNDYIMPSITYLIKKENNMFLAYFENGEIKLFDGTKYILNNIEVDKDMYEEIYKYGKSIN